MPELQSDNGSFEGYGSVFYKLDRHGHMVMPGAFRESLPKFLKEGFIGGVGHDYGKPIGRYQKAYEDDRGLYVFGTLSDVPEARTVRTLLKDGVLSKLSIGYEDRETEEIAPGQVKALWRKAGYSPDEDDLYRLKALQSRNKTVKIIHKANLLEVSPVAVPSNDEARILAYKNVEDVPEFLNFIHTARKAAFKLGQKKGRKISSANEMKLRAMTEVLASVTEEIQSILMLVEREPEINDGSEQGQEQEQEQEPEGEEPAGPNPAEAAEEEDEEDSEQKAKRTAKFQKSAQLKTRIRIMELLAKGC